MPAMNLLLSDLDGVLLESHSYHESLQRTMDLVGEALGFGPPVLPLEGVLAYEAAGITSEWDSSAMCTALLLERLWQLNPDANLGLRLPEEPLPPHGLPVPDLAGFATALSRDRSTESRPRENAIELLRSRFAHLPPVRLGALISLVQDGRDPARSLTFRLIQELNLGSERYEALYQLAPQLQTKSYLSTCDRPMLNPSEREALRAWIERPKHAFAIFTNRPSSGPDGTSGAPEAEIGIACAGLDGLPIVGMGDLGWLANQRGMEPHSLLKPSAVHVLTAMQLALGADMPNALMDAAKLALDGELGLGWSVLDGASVLAIEDASKGVRSAAAAAASLRKHGLNLRLTLLGIPDHPAKARALRDAGASIVTDIHQALDSLPGWHRPS
jgi:hypothetical protein